jgi:sulfate transport system permease protein
MRDLTPRSPITWLIIAVVMGYALILFGLPIVVIVGSAFQKGLDPIIKTFQDASVQHAILVTFSLGGLAVVFNAFAGLLTAWVLTRHSFPGKGLLNAMVDIPFVFSPVIAGYAMVVLFGRVGWFAPTLFPIVFALPGILLAKIFVSLPFVTRELQPVLESITPEQEHAAYTMGASRWLTFRRVILPEIWTALLYGLVLTFARAVGEFGAVAVVSGSIQGYTETATSFVFRAINDRNPSGAYSVSLALMLVSLAILVLLNFLKHRLTTRKG